MNQNQGRHDRSKIFNLWIIIFMGAGKHWAPAHPFWLHSPNYAAKLWLIFLPLTHIQRKDSRLKPKPFSLRRAIAE